MKPAVFIGSSRESLKLAYAIRQRLDDQADLTVWAQGIFRLSKSGIKSLSTAVKRFDFGIFVLLKDDLSRLRDLQSREIRDSLMFELGLFAGAIGKDRIFVLIPNEVHDGLLPSDLFGIVPVKFEVTSNAKTIDAVINSACRKILKSILKKGPLHAENATLTDRKVRPSLLTPHSSLLNELINSAIETVCRAVALPQGPESSKIRVFIFRKEADKLVCSHYWAPNPVREMVGKLRFDITPEIAKRVAVVRSIINKELTRTKVAPLPRKIESLTGYVSEDLSFVLAAPIFGRDGHIWGTVDFDASTESAKQFLSDSVSDAVILQLAQHLQIIFSLRN